MADESSKEFHASIPPAPPELSGPSGPALTPTQESARKIAELEKRLQAEREKVLLANLKTQEESAA
ncbi:MAG TPA: hypothetical protein VNI01_12855, partial [Elusimicrobiota bacterium]|nr:hypothetical protein [Elusimicrobiota bacterium]